MTNPELIFLQDTTRRVSDLAPMRPCGFLVPDLKDLHAWCERLERIDMSLISSRGLRFPALTLVLSLGF
jgi:hypothetical protein